MVFLENYYYVARRRKALDGQFVLTDARTRRFGESATNQGKRLNASRRGKYTEAQRLKELERHRAQTEATRGSVFAVRTKPVYNFINNS